MVIDRHRAGHRTRTRDRDRDRDQDRDRAQMILVGAVTIALVVLGLSVVLNTVIFTETMSSTEATAGIDEAREFDHEARNGAGLLILRLNHRHRNVTGPELATHTDANMTAYSNAYSESYASSRGVVVNLTYNNGSSAFGRRLVQTGDGTLTNVSNGSTWTPIPASQRRTVGWFSVNVDVDGTDTDPTTVVVTNASGASVNLTLWATGSGSGLNVSSNVSYAGHTVVTCNPSGNRVLLNLVDGRSFDDDCAFNGTRALAPPYDVRVEGGSHLVAKYALVVDEPVTTAAYGSCSSGGPSPIQPCVAPVVWTANVTVGFAGGDIQYTNTDNVTIYREAA